MDSLFGCGNVINFGLYEFKRVVGPAFPMPFVQFTLCILVILSMHYESMGDRFFKQGDPGIPKPYSFYFHMAGFKVRIGLGSCIDCFVSEIHLHDILWVGASWR